MNMYDQKIKTTIAFYKCILCYNKKAVYLEIVLIRKKTHMKLKYVRPICLIDAAKKVAFVDP